jgi:hypothetical protein
MRFGEIITDATRLGLRIEFSHAPEIEALLIRVTDAAGSPRDRWFTTRAVCWRDIADCRFDLIEHELEFAIRQHLENREKQNVNHGD